MTAAVPHLHSTTEAAQQQTRPVVGVPNEEKKHRKEKHKPLVGAASGRRERSNSDASADARKEEEGGFKYMSSTDCSIDSRNSSFKEELKEIKPSEDAEVVKDVGPPLPSHIEQAALATTTGPSAKATATATAFHGAGKKLPHTVSQEWPKTAEAGWQGKNSVPEEGASTASASAPQPKPGPGSGAGAGKQQ